MSTENTKETSHDLEVLQDLYDTCIYDIEDGVNAFDNGEDSASVAAYYQMLQRATIAAKVIDVMTAARLALRAEAPEEPFVGGLPGQAWGNDKYVSNPIPCAHTSDHPGPFHSTVSPSPPTPYTDPTGLPGPTWKTGPETLSTTYTKTE